MILILAKGKLTYYEEIKDQLHDTNKDDISKADDISVGVDDFKDANENSREALADEVEGCDVDKVKTEPDDLEEEELKKDMKALEDQDEGQRINAFDAVKVKTESEV